MRRYLTTVTPSMARGFHASGEWQDDTLFGLVLRHAEARPLAPALVDERGSVTRAEMVLAVETVAGMLADRGVVAGTPVLIQLPNSSIFGVANIAINALGAVIVPLNLSMRAAEVVAVAQRVGARTMIAAGLDPRRVEELVAAGIDIVTDDVLWHDIVSGRRPEWNRSDAVGDADDVLDLMFTSGTTGLPKGIINTTNTKLAALRPVVEALGHGMDDAWLVVPPMAHNAGWLYSFLPALLSGGMVVFLERFSATRTLELMREHNIRGVFLTPTHANDVLEAYAADPRPVPLQYVLIGGAATKPSVRQAIRELLGAEVISMYGCTENQAATFTRPGTPVELADVSAGQACPGTELAVFDEARRVRLEAGRVGHIGTRSSATFAGYFDDQAATDAAFNADGFFFAGDLGFVDEHGLLHPTGRDKELIIRGGHNIVPDDVERAIEGLSGIERVAAVGIPDDRLGERVCVVVVGDPSIDLETITAHLRSGGVGTHLWPEALLLVQKFPLTDIGKVRRGELRKMATAALEAGTLVTVRGAGRA
ncbi:class I adenylate-forming enzyme family protein [Gordonia polyisoprenivorans]|uniref:class I adenylate-forming enzyme family protein n=1 Tax=Gordonia polyisoprenivorans TaxID=84595 RepID=UPI001AD6DA1C|nr:class I adenylate-forming enzyme family protein [Gordonia polyisoprenivorans]QTI69944.1 acyl--CoA ligase [Gordonia polyisoprenivorans]